MAEYIAGLHPDILIMDYDHNAPTPEHLDATHEAFFKSFRNLEKIISDMASIPNRRRVFAMGILK